MVSCTKPKGKEEVNLDEKYDESTEARGIVVDDDGRKFSFEIFFAHLGSSDEGSSRSCIRVMVVGDGSAPIGRGCVLKCMGRCRKIKHTLHAVTIQSQMITYVASPQKTTCEIF